MSIYAYSDGEISRYPGNFHNDNPCHLDKGKSVSTFSGE
jgi:hypothetical protein